MFLTAPGLRVHNIGNFGDLGDSTVCAVGIGYTNLGNKPFWIYFGLGVLGCAPEYNSATLALVV